MPTNRKVIDFKIHNLTEEQFQELKEAGQIDPNAIYCTPDETVVNFEKINTEIEALTQIINGIISDYVKKSGDTMTGALNVPEITVQTAEGTFTVSVVAGVVTIATNNGLDIVAQTKFDTAPTTDDNTTWADVNPTALVTKQQVATAVSEASGGTTITLKEYDE